MKWGEHTSRAGRLRTAGRTTSAAPRIARGGRPRSGRGSRIGARLRRGSGQPAPFVETVAQVAAAIRAGARPGDAWGAMGIRTDDGVPRWTDLDERAGSDGSAARAVLAAARCAADVGAAPAGMLDRIVAALGRDADAASQRAAALAGPRATAAVLAWLPAVGVLLGVALGADPLAVLLDGGAGTGLLGLGALLTAVGQVWTRRHVRAAVAAGEE